MVKIDKNTGESFVKILEIMSALRDPKTGCEWDKDQDSNSIKSYCIEEAYEVVEAIENNDNNALCEELGDLLFQVIFHSEIHNEKGNFSIIDVIDNLSNNSNTRIRIRNPNGSIMYNSSSDYRLKENDIKITDGIIKLKKLRPIRFNWKTDTSTQYDGFFAHEVSEACPDAVDGIKDEVALQDIESENLKKGDPIYQGIDASKLIPLLTAALQETIVKIETLETKVAALETS